MKNSLLLALGLTFAAGPGLYAQTTNTVSFQNDNNSLITNGLTGAAVVTNELIFASLYVAPDMTTDEGAFVRFGSAVGIGGPVGGPAGRYNGGNRPIAGYPPGAFVMVQVRAFEISRGTNYEAALAAPPTGGRTALVGKSAVARVQLGAGSTNSSTRLCGPFAVYPAGNGGYLTVGDIAVAEGSNGVVNAVFTVRLLHAQPETVSVDFATENGTAVAGQDYQATSGTLVFAPGETTHAVPVVLTADAPTEPEETFYLGLSNAVNGSILRSRGSCLITEVRITAMSIDTSISFNTISGRRYLVEKTLDSLTWAPVSAATNVLGTGGIVTVVDRGSGCQPMTVYRAHLIVP